MEKIKCNFSILKEDELLKIKERLLYLRAKEGSELMMLADADVAVKNLAYFSYKNNVAKFYKNDEFIGIVAFDVSTHWWTDKKVLCELLVLCLSDSFKGFGRIAVDKLEALAKEHNAEIIVVVVCFKKNHKLLLIFILKRAISYLCLIMSNF